MGLAVGAVAISPCAAGLCSFCDSEESGFGDTTADDETGLTPDPIPRTENRQNFIAKFFFGDFIHPGVLKKRF